MGLLPEAFPAKCTTEGFFSGVCSHMDIDRVSILESFVTNGAVMQQSGLFPGLLRILLVTCCRSLRANEGGS